MAASLLSIPPRGAAANAALWQPLYKFLRGEDTTKRALMASDDDTNYVAQYHNIDSTHGRGLWVSYGNLASPTTIVKADKDSFQVGSPITPVTGSTLSLAPGAGQTVSIVQNAYTEAVVFGLQVAKLVHAPSSGLLTSSATAQFLQTFRDDLAVGADPVIVQVFGGSSGLGRTSFRSFEAIGGRYAATSGNTSFGAYGAVNPATMDIGSTRVITANLFVEAAITAAYTQAIDAIGVMAYSGAQDATIDGRSIATVRSGTVAFGALAGGSNRATQGGWDYFALGDADPFGTLAGPPATRYFHIRTTGASDQLYLAGSATLTGVGMRLTELSSSTTRDIYVGGLTSGHPGGLLISNLQDSRFMVIVERSASVDQWLYQNGTDLLPAIAGQGDPDTGIRWGTAANTLTFIANATAKAHVNANGFGVGGVAPANVSLYVSSGANPGVRIDGAGNFATTVGAAGGASAQPATPLGYLIVNANGTLVKIPYHNV